MSSTAVVQLLPPVVLKEKITKDQYGKLPPYLQPIVKNYAYVWKTTVMPGKTATSGHCRVFILAPANFRSGRVILENTGRVPLQAPAKELDDLRPIVFYAFGGTGSQKFRVTLDADHNNYKEKVVIFE